MKCNLITLWKAYVRSIATGNPTFYEKEHRGFEAELREIFQIRWKSKEGKQIALFYRKEILGE